MQLLMMIDIFLFNLSIKNANQLHVYDSIDSVNWINKE